MKDDPITAQLIPLAWTPLGLAIGTGRQGVGIARAGLFDWVDRTFPADDEHAFVASMRDLDLLVRIGWESSWPEKLDERGILNAEDLPDDLAQALAHSPAPLIACAVCRRLCVRDDFRWKERPLCAWDYHAQVFGKRGPWHEGRYETRHFETLPACAYLVPELLSELSVDVLVTVGTLAGLPAETIVNSAIESDPERPHMAVKTESGIAVLRES